MFSILHLSVRLNRDFKKTKARITQQKITLKFLKDLTDFKKNKKQMIFLGIH